MQGCDRSSGWANPAIGLHHTSHSTWSRRRKPGRPSHLLHCSARDVGVHVASAQVVAVHPAGSISPYKSALWQVSCLCARITGLAAVSMLKKIEMYSVQVAYASLTVVLEKRLKCAENDAGIKTKLFVPIYNPFLCALA